MTIDHKTLGEVIDRVAKEVADQVYPTDTTVRVDVTGPSRGVVVGAVSSHEQANEAARDVLNVLASAPGTTGLLQSIAADCLRLVNAGDLRMYAGWVRKELARTEQALQLVEALADRLEQRP